MRICFKWLWKKNKSVVPIESFLLLFLHIFGITLRDIVKWHMKSSLKICFIKIPNLGIIAFCKVAQRFGKVAKPLYCGES
jgi:hypothetical protein